MRFSLRRIGAAAGVALAVAGAAPVASAVAATPLTPVNQIPQLTLPVPIGLPFQQQPAGSCGPNQGLPFGILNLGPTGPLGPLGADGPLGAGHLPCGISIWDLGPAGPLGPHGALGSGS
jgi:hypothetical protein